MREVGDEGSSERLVLLGHDGNVAAVVLEPGVLKELLVPGVVGAGCRVCQDRSGIVPGVPG
jgi:hypothetical protein